MRLVRTLCPKCKDAYVPSSDVLRMIGLSGSDARRLVLYRPVGCELCNGTGYRGRTGVYEILEMKETLRRLVTSSASEAMIRTAAIEDGMVPIGQDGLSKALAGETTLDELHRVIYTPEESGRICGGCHATISTEYVFCPHCGTRADLSCEQCGKRVAPEWSYCTGCGHPRDGIVEAEPGALDPSGFAP